MHSPPREYRPVWPFIACASALLIAVLPIPYVYYTILRISVAATCFYAIASAPIENDRPYVRWAVFIAIMLVFGVGAMAREQWAAVDVTFAAFFLMVAVGYRLRDWHDRRSATLKREGMLVTHQLIAETEQRRKSQTQDSLPF